MKKDIPKRKTPFFFTSKSSNYFLLHRHFISIDIIDKTELLIFQAKHGPAPPLDSMNIGDLAISSSKSCMSIGVTFDSYMNFDEHTKNICRIAFYKIRNIA